MSCALRLVAISYAPPQFSRFRLAPFRVNDARGMNQLQYRNELVLRLQPLHRLLDAFMSRIASPILTDRLIAEPALYVGFPAGSTFLSRDPFKDHGPAPGPPRASPPTSIAALTAGPASCRGWPHKGERRARVPGRPGWAGPRAAAAAPPGSRRRPAARGRWGWSTRHPGRGADGARGSARRRRARGRRDRAGSESRWG